MSSSAHSDYVVAIKLLMGNTVEQIAESMGLFRDEAVRLVASEGVAKAKRKLEHTPQPMQLAAAQGVLLEALPDVLAGVVDVAKDPTHKSWRFGVKLYLDRVMPTLAEGVVHHTHEVGAESREAVLAASASLTRLVDELTPQLEAFTGLRSGAQRVHARVLRGAAAKPQPLVLEAEVADEESA